MASLEKMRLIYGSNRRNDLLNYENWKNSLDNPTEFYEDCFLYFHKDLPKVFKAHRSYFSRSKRGFGEDAFHVMWYLLFRRFRPASFLEIGVYRGQTLSLVSLLQQQNGIHGHVVGISPFEAAGDSVSNYSGAVDYLADTLSNFSYFKLKKPTLLKAYSTDQAARDLVASKKWDCIYIDGNHDYEVAHSDWNLCSNNLAPDGIIILDDSALGTAYRPPAFATGGHPGPSRLAGEILPHLFKEILQVGHNRVFQKIV